MASCAWVPQRFNVFPAGFCVRLNQEMKCRRASIGGDGISTLITCGSRIIRELTRLFDSVTKRTVSVAFMNSESEIQSCTMLTRCLSAWLKLLISPSGSNISVASMMMSSFSANNFSPRWFVVREMRQNWRRSSSASVGLPIASSR